MAFGWTVVKLLALWEGTHMAIEYHVGITKADYHMIHHAIVDLTGICGSDPSLIELNKRLGQTAYKCEQVPYIQKQ